MIVFDLVALDWILFDVGLVVVSLGASGLRFAGVGIIHLFRVCRCFGFECLCWVL